MPEILAPGLPGFRAEALLLAKLRKRVADPVRAEIGQVNRLEGTLEDRSYGRGVCPKSPFDTKVQEPLDGCCQTNANQSQFAPARRISGCAELTPLGKSGGAVELEVVPAVEVAFLIKEIVDGGMDGGEFLQTSHPPEAEHRPFSSSKWLV